MLDSTFEDPQEVIKRFSKYQDFRMPSNIRFGIDSYFSIHDDIRELKPKKIILISDNGLVKAGVVDKISKSLSKHSIPISKYTSIYGEPTFNILKEVIEFIRIEQADLVVGIGGGSALDVAKAASAIADKQDIEEYLSGEKKIDSRVIPCILLPTTSGTGSEVTMNAIFEDTEQELKRGIVSPYFLPTIAIVDPALTLSCPPSVSAASGIDAFTHAIESYVSKKATPMTKMFAVKAMQMFSKNITKVVFDGYDIKAREQMSWVSMLAGVTLANAGVGAVHALAYPLGGKYHIQHGVANALLLPYVFKVIGKTCLDEMVEIAGFLEIGDYKKEPHKALDAVIQYFYNLLDDLDLPTSLSELNVEESTLEEMAEQASKTNRLLNNSPYTLKKDKILGIYKDAFSGYKNNGGI